MPSNTQQQKQRLSWDKYWRLVMKLYSEAGGTTHFPEEELRANYDKGLSPLLAMENAIAKHSKETA